MAGIPILQVSLNYFYSIMLQAGFIALVIVVINSIISVGYYFKVILAMYKEPNEEER
jgi:NADH-quinone oxidoreductase subunit N